MVCILSSWCHCHPIISFFIKIQIVLTFLVPSYPDCPGKEAVKWVFVCLWLLFNFCVLVVCITCQDHRSFSLISFIFFFVSNLTLSCQWIYAKATTQQGMPGWFSKMTVFLSASFFIRCMINFCWLVISTVCVSASVNLPLHHKSRSYLLEPAHPGGTGKGAKKWLWCDGDNINWFLCISYHWL